MTVHLQNSQLLYAVKANMNPVLMQVMLDAEPELGFDCSSPGELKIAREVGGKEAHIIFSGNYESPEDLKYALSAGVPINFDDITSYQRCREIGMPEVISFRVNPGEGKGAFPGIVTAGDDVKFGISREKIGDAYRMAMDDGVKQFGLHTMVGSGILDADYFAWNCDRVLEIATSLEQELGIHFEFIDLGGGFGIPYNENESPLNTEKLFAGVGEITDKYYTADSPTIIYEPGRYLIGDAGFVLTSVTGTKEDEQYYAGLDIGMNQFLRPVLYNAYHRIIPLGKAAHRETRRTQVTGQVCENTDRLARDRALPKLQTGDLCAILDAGAYGFAMASQYNGRPLPAEVLVDGDTVSLIRQRESLDDLTKNVAYPLG